MSLERTRTEGTTLINLDKAQDSKGGAPSPPLGGLGRRPVSAANAVDLDLEVEVDFKTQNCHLSPKLTISLSTKSHDAAVAATPTTIWYA